MSKVLTTQLDLGCIFYDDGTYRAIGSGEIRYWKIDEEGCVYIDFPCQINGGVGQAIRLKIGQ